MKRSRDISLFRILLFSFAVFYQRSFLLFAIFALFLLLYDRRAAISFILLCSIIFFLDRYRFDFIPIGIVETKKETYVIVDKLLYKIRLTGCGELSIGDVLYFNNGFQLNEYETQVSRNILFTGEGGYIFLFRFFPRSFLHNRTIQLSSDSAALIKKLLYNEYSENLPFDTGPGLASYYLFKKIRRRSPKICLFILLLYTLLFVFDIRFYLLVIDCILDKAETGGIKSTFCRCSVIAMINLKLFSNPSFQLAFLLDLYHSFSFQVSFKSYLAILFSILFGESDLISILFFEKLTVLRILILLLSFATLLIPSLDLLYSSSLKLMTLINSFSIPIRGSLSVFGYILFFCLCRKWKLKRHVLQLPLLILIMVLPIHHPLSHITFIDVGQGDAIMIRKPFIPSCILIDTGSIYNYGRLKKKLSKEGIYVIDRLIITHEDSDHSGNTERLRNDFMIREIVSEGKDIDYGSYHFKFLGMRDFSNDNDNSLVYLLKVSGITILLTGDISFKAERELVRKYGPLNADILKVSHHGSRTGTGEELLSQILPEIAIISTSGQYDHPHPETIERLERYGVKWYTTRQHGSIGIHFSRFFPILATAKNEFVIMRS